MIIPLLHRIVVKQDKFEEVDSVHRRAAELGLEIPKDEQQVRKQASVDKGIVISISETAFRDFGLQKSPVEIGDYVVYARNAGKLVSDPYTDEEFVVLNDEDLVAIFKKD